MPILVTESESESRIRIEPESALGKLYRLFLYTVFRKKQLHVIDFFK